MSAPPPTYEEKERFQPAPGPDQYPQAVSGGPQAMGPPPVGGPQAMGPPVTQPPSYSVPPPGMAPYTQYTPGYSTQGGYIAQPVPVQQPVYMAQPPVIGGPSDYMGLSVFSTLFCCLCIGIFALMKSREVGNAKRMGRVQDAQILSNEALRLNKIAIGVGIFFTSGYIAIIVVYYAVLFPRIYNFGD